jgi:hypothetical protein
MKQIFFKLDEYPEIQFKGGSMDRERLNGCYLEIKGCLESKMTDHEKTISKFTHRLSKTVEKFLSNSILCNKYLRHDNISESFQYTGFSFSQIEFTFFPKTKTDKETLTQELNKLIKEIHSNNIVDNPELSFHKNLYKGNRNGKK